MKYYKSLFAGMAFISTLALVVSSQGMASTQSTNSSGDKTKENSSGTEIIEATAKAPAPFDGKVTIAIVQQTGQGDYFQQYLNGTRQQAKALGVKLLTYDARGNNAKQATLINLAIAANIDGLIVRHGLPSSICPGVNKAIDKGIPVIVYDVEVRECAPKAIQAQQSDVKMASLVLDKMAEDIGKNKKVGYVNISGIAPLDRRNAVWKQYVEKYGWDVQFKTGTFTSSSATDTAPMVVAALRAHPNVKAIYAPYDEFSKGTLSALAQLPRLEDKIDVYGADISTADIQLMRSKNSPWVATAATDPNAIGAAVLRALALHMAGQLDKHMVKFSPIFITQGFLRKHDIQNMADLREAEPGLNLTKVASPDWMPVVNF